MIKPYTNAWKRIAKKSTLFDIVIHAALKAYFMRPSNLVSREEVFKGQISKAFTPISNFNKLMNGAWEFQSLDTTFKWLYFNLYKENKKNFTFFNMKQEDIIEEIFGGNPDNFNYFLDFLKDNLDIKTRNQYTKFNKRYYCYIFVKQGDYEPIYQAVQAAHVAMVIGQNMDENIHAEEVVYQICKVKDTAEADEIDQRLLENGFDVEYFYETDMDDVIAFGIYPVPSYKREKLLQYPLLTF